MCRVRLEVGKLLRTFCSASFVSICTMVTSASFASSRYSAVVCWLNFSIGNGDPKPRVPKGGNFADETRRRASSAVYRSGTSTPCAPASSAPANAISIAAWWCVLMVVLLTIHASFAATLTTGLTPHAAIAATASCIAPSAPWEVSPDPCHGCRAGVCVCSSRAVDVPMFAIDTHPVHAAPRHRPSEVGARQHLPPTVSSFIGKIRGKINGSPAMRQRSPRPS